MKALIIGATGSVGKCLTDALLEDNTYNSVVVFVRRSSGKSHPKLREYIIDFSKLENYKELITGDILFSCLGTTLKEAGSQEKYWEINFDIFWKFAWIARENEVSSCVMISSYCASLKSSVFYSPLKIVLEEGIAGCDFWQFLIFRPGLILRNGKYLRGEKIAMRIIKTFNALGVLKRYEPIPIHILVEKLVKAPKVMCSGISILELDNILKI
ncbi:NAD-dependent epimerase/dehydratase family protein [Flavobacterium sp. FlaQc-30]|uniref:NAD-dependent epimerase/dehydratase family protein n=1 Tax=Flavobacterium sp. FlaQc-30 TaxID=3374179 RepID=UPI00375747CE